MNILLTGATGFVGRRLGALLERQHQVVALSRVATGRVGEIVADLREPLNTALLPARIDAVVHTAAVMGVDPDEAPLRRRINVQATRELVQYAARAGANRFMFFSSGAVYRPTAECLTESSSIGPADDYGRSKVDAESVINAHADQMAVQIVRPFFPYGPSQRDRLVPRLIRRVSQAQAISLADPNGAPLLTPIYIDDLAACAVRLLERGQSLIVNLCGRETMSMRELSRAIGRHMARDVRFEVRSSGMVANWRASGDYAARLCGFAPSTPFEEGIARTIAEYGG